MTTDIADSYKIPAEVMALVRNGFLEVINEDEAQKTVEFHIPSRRQRDDEGASQVGRSSGFTLTLTSSSATTMTKSRAIFRTSTPKRTPLI